MAKQTINVGTTANDRTGDPLRTAFTKVNSNFTELYANVATLNSSVVTDVSDLTDTQGLLFSGDYQDLANTPFIATDISDLTDSEDLLTVKDHITLNGIHQASNNVISFTKAPNTDANTVFDQISQFISITRDVGGGGGQGGGIYNRALEAEWDPAVSPLFTVWNAEGWSDLSDVEVRYYQPFRQVLENNIGLNVVDKELIMKDTLLNEYYKVKFTTWAQGPSHTGAFAYTREKIDTTVPIGITFYDGSKLPKAPDTRLQFEQAYIGDYGDHVLTISEAGRQIYAYGNILEIPSYAEQDFKIGATIQIVTGATGSTLRPKVNGNVQIPDATLYIQGETTAASSFAIPPRSMALLTKTRQNIWQLSIGDLSVAKTDFIPDTDNAYDLGSPTNQWKSLHVSANTIFVGGTPISIDAGGTLTVDGAPVVGGTNLPYLDLTNNPLIVLPAVLDQPISFTRLANVPNTDFIDTGLTLARGSVGALYNAESEQAYDNSTHLSPAGTRWNADGWGDLSDITTRNYSTLRSVLNNAIGENILTAELIMHDTINDKYYKFDFTNWGQNNGGSFAYTRTLIENPNFFKKVDYATGNTAIDVFVADDGMGSGIAITRGVNQGIYNPFREEGWNGNISPDGTLWNTDGWDDLRNIETRTYDNFSDAYNGNLGLNVPGSKSVMYIPDTGEYYAIQWLSWTQNNAGGGFSYVKYKIDLTKLNEGIAFADGSVLKSGAGLGRVKLSSPGSRRIEEVYGYKEVTVTPVVTVDLTTIASRAGVDETRLWIDSSNTTIDDILDNYNAAGIIDANSIQFSLDNATWYTHNGSTSYNGTERGYGVTIPQNGQNLNYNIGDTIYFRYNTGGAPQIWWDKSELPGGASYFRGATIDYHAYTGDSNIIGTIHIVDDDGEEHISHSEVQSGSTDGENDDLWYVTSEGQIKYRRIDGAGKTLKVQWSAKVFYGSETWD